MALLYLAHTCYLHLSESTTTQTHSFKGSLSLTLDVRSHAVALLLTRWIRIIEALPPPPPPSRLCSGKLLLLFFLAIAANDDTEMPKPFPVKTTTKNPSSD